VSRAIALLTVVVAVSPVAAGEYAPRVVGEHRADAYSMRTFRQFPRWRDLQGDALAWEVYRYLVDTQSGVFHMNQVLEGSDALSEYRTVRDPVKILNGYGYGYCGIFGPLMAGIWQDMGEGPARTLVLPGWNHVCSEVYYNDAWHYLDLDVRAAFRRDDGRLASMAAARAEADLWRNRGPLFFPNDPLESTRKIYVQTPVHHYHGFHQSGHTMDFVLRQGERVTRWWTPQGGRWHHAPEYNDSAWLRRLIEQEPVGPKPNHRHFTVHNYANGRFVYEPNLTAASTDLQDGLYDARNVHATTDGLTLIEAGSGEAVFEFRTPYIIVPRVGDLDTTDDDCEASVIEIDARGVSLSVSRDGGIRWEALPNPSDPIDLTRQVAGTYGYLLKLSLSGKPNESIVRRLLVTTWVQVAPAALPALARGVNRFEYRTGDHYGLPTRVLEVRSQANDPETVAKYVVEPPADYDPGRRTDRIHGPVTVRVAAPPKTRIAWFGAGAAFRTHLHQAARNTRNSIRYAVGTPHDFQQIYRAEVPDDTEHWHYNAYREVRLPEPANTVYVRYEGDPALNNFWIYAHCLDEERRSSGPVEITHAWTESGQPKRQTVRMDKPGPYEINVENEPQEDWIEIAVPSR